MHRLVFYKKSIWVDQGLLNNETAEGKTHDWDIKLTLQRIKTQDELICVNREHFLPEILTEVL